MKIKIFTRWMLLLLTFVIVLLVFGFLSKKQYAYLFNTLSLYISFLVVIDLEGKGKFKINRNITMLFAIVIILHSAVGQYFGVYKTSRVFDKFLHVLGTYAISLLVFEICKVKFSLNSKVLVFYFIMFLGITLGVLLEIFEFSLDSLLNSYHQKGLTDTNLDLIFNVFGALLAGFSGITTHISEKQ